MRPFILFCILTAGIIVCAQEKLPIIDMHLHANPASMNGPPPTAFCAPPEELPYRDPGKNWMDIFIQWVKNPDCEPYDGKLSSTVLRRDKGGVIRLRYPTNQRNGKINFKEKSI